MSIKSAFLPGLNQEQIRRKRHSGPKVSILKVQSSNHQLVHRAPVNQSGFNTYIQVLCWVAFSTNSIILWYCLGVHIICQPTTRTSEAAFPKAFLVPVENFLNHSCPIRGEYKVSFHVHLKLHVTSTSWTAFSGDNSKLEITSYDFQILLLREPVFQT